MTLGDAIAAILQGGIHERMAAQAEVRERLEVRRKLLQRAVVAFRHCEKHYGIMKHRELVAEIEEECAKE